MEKDTENFIIKKKENSSRIILPLKEKSWVVTVFVVLFLGFVTYTLFVFLKLLIFDDPAWVFNILATLFIVIGYKNCFVFLRVLIGKEELETLNPQVH